MPCNGDLELILALFWALEGHLGSFLGRFGPRLQNGLLATRCAPGGPKFPQLHFCDFACSQLGSPGASLEGSGCLLGPFVGHLWSIWGPFGDVFGPWQGHLEAFWGLLGFCLKPFSAVLGAACRLLENSNDSWMTWGWAGVPSIPIIPFVSLSFSESKGAPKEQYSIDSTSSQRWPVTSMVLREPVEHASKTRLGFAEF